jgi:hypothetical protein
MIYVFFFNFEYPLRCLHVPPGVRVPQVEYQCFIWYMDKQRYGQLHYYSLFMLLFILYSYHCSYKGLIVMRISSLCVLVLIKSFRSLLQYGIKILKYTLEQQVFLYDIYMKNK